jgi:glutamate synthase (NADPH/NADH) small chain
MKIIAIQERVSNYNEFTIPLAKEDKKRIRCMDCGIRFATVPAL